MTTEDDFHAALDAQPDDWQTRLVFADWLDERGDPRADGYRALGVLGRWPFEYGLDQPSEVQRWSYHNGGGNYQAVNRPYGRVDARHALPPDWLAVLITGTDETTWCLPLNSRREAEDTAARAFTQLPAERRAELLMPPARPGN